LISLPLFVSSGEGKQENSKVKSWYASRICKVGRGSQLLEIRWPPIIKRAVSEAQSVLAASSDRTSKNGSNEHYTWFNRLLGEFDVDKYGFIRIPDPDYI
jgi:hypothetical protein